MSSGQKEIVPCAPDGMFRTLVISHPHGPVTHTDHETLEEAKAMADEKCVSRAKSVVYDDRGEPVYAPCGTLQFAAKSAAASTGAVPSRVRATIELQVPVREPKK